MAGYRIPTQPEGTRVSWWPDPRGPGYGEHFWGTIIQHTADTVLITWDGEDEFYERWDGRDMRYRIDRGQMRLHRPPKQRRVRIPADELLCKVCGRPRQLKCGCPRVGAVKPEEWGSTKVRAGLTLASGSDTIDSSLEGQGAPDPKEGTTIMSDDATNKLSAKEAATQLGTDARTLRKFLRKRSGLVGQGNRWEIDPKEIKGLKKEFEAYLKGTDEAKAARAEAKAAKAAKAEPPADDLEADFEELDDSIDPEELEALEDLEDLEVI